MPRRPAMPTLTRLCLQSLAQHMQSLWAKHYSDNNLEEYNFSFLVGPFNDLAGELVEELLELLRARRALSRAALQLLLLPQLRQFSMQHYCGLANNALGHLIVTRCQGLTVLDLANCGRLSPSVLVDVAEGLPRLTRLGLRSTQANLQVLSAVGSCCRQLRELNVTDCRKVTARALRHLAYDPLTQTPGCPELRVLLAQEIENKEDGDMTAAVAFLLLALPSLEVLAHWDVRKALQLLQSRQLGSLEDSEGFPTLEELMRGRGAAPEGPPLTLALQQLEFVEEDVLSALHAICPQAKEVSVWLDDDSPVVPSGLQQLSGWECLSRVKLSCCGRQGRPLAEVLPLAQSLSTQLHTLQLQNFSWRDPLTLLTLLASCPALQNFHAVLEVPPDSHSPEEPPAPSPRWATDLLPRGLRQLQSFTLILPDPVPDSHWPVLGSTLASVLCQAPQLQSLSLLSVPFPLDSVLEAALAGSGLRELQQLSLVRSFVSAGTVWQLLGTDGPLRRLDLSYCPDIYRRDYDSFLRAVKKQRLELEIIWQ